jgi:hypothetical protein
LPGGCRPALRPTDRAASEAALLTGLDHSCLSRDRCGHLSIGVNPAPCHSIKVGSWSLYQQCHQGQSSDICLVMRRREFAELVVILAAVGLVSTLLVRRSSIQKSALATPRPPTSLLSARIELTGDWDQDLRRAAGQVLERARQACLGDIRLVSDRQPGWLRVEESSGTPAIWLHPDDPGMAWIIVNIGERDWSKLAYQFGHELGHVFANSWQRDDKPSLPCQWLEEALVEAFSLRGLGLLAAGWKKNPPFAGDGAFGDAIARYRENIVREYASLADSQGLTHDAEAWFADHRAEIEAGGLVPYGQAMAGVLLSEFEAEPDCVEAIGALNRWPGRTAVPIADYLRRWESSCEELEASVRLPMRLRELLKLS